MFACIKSRAWFTCFSLGAERVCARICACMCKCLLLPLVQQQGATGLWTPTPAWWRPSEAFEHWCIVHVCCSGGPVLITDTWLQGPFGWPPRYDFEGADAVQERTHAAVEVGIKSSVDVFQWLFSFFILHLTQRNVCAILCVCPCANTRKHTQKHLHVACVFIHAQTNANTRKHARPVAFMLIHAQRHAEHLHVRQYSNTRKHTHEHLLVACVFIHAKTHANTRKHARRSCCPFPAHAVDQLVHMSCRL